MRDDARVSRAVDAARRWLWLPILLAAGAAVATGALPTADAADLLVRIGPVLLFLGLLTVVAEIAAAAQVFDVTAGWAVRAGRGRTWLLWLLVVALAWACTAVLSLDATAVLLTPVVIAVARRAGVSLGLMAMTTVWLAATGSLLLPVSNLTNLLAADRLGFGVRDYLALAWAPAVAAVAVTAAVLAILFRRDLRQPYVLLAPVVVRDRIWCTATSLTCVGLVPLFVSGLPVVVGAAAAVVALLGVTAWRRPSALRRLQVPWRMVLAVLGLFLLVQTAHDHGLARLAAAVAGSGDDPAALGRLAVVAAVAANAVDNLPAYLALEPVAHSPARMMALLIGVGAGPLLTPWASLATLLWADRCRAAGVDVDWWRFAWRGLVLVPLVLAAAVGALVAVS